MILIDGHALAFRSYFALERTRMQTTDMQPTWAVYGFFKAIFDMIKNKDYKFDCIAVAFDVSHHTFRTEQFEDYKANREAMPDSLRSQMSLIMEGLKAFNIPIYTKEGYEADDVIGTISKKSMAEGNKTIILTGDRDAFQLVDDKGYVKVLIPSKGELIEYNKQKVYEKMGVFPSQIADLKGLSGDKSDNIPGVMGIGDKTAAGLLSRFRTVEGIYEHIDEIEQKGVREKLIKDEKMAFMSKDLATIRTNVDIDFDIECAKLELPDFLEAQAFFKKVQFYGFLKNFEQIQSYFNAKGEDAIVQGKNAGITENSFDKEESIVKFKDIPQMQLGLFATSTPTVNTKFDKITVDTKEKLIDLIKELNSQTLFSIDTETTSLNPIHTDLVGISIAYNPQMTVKNNRFELDSSKIDSTKSYYIPVFHQIGEQLDTDYVLENLKPVLENESIKKTFQNVKFDINVFRKYGITVQGVMFDTMLASYVKNPSRRHGLKTQAFEHLDYEMTRIDELDGNEKNQITMECVSIQDATNYACDDAFATLELTKYWNNELSEKEKTLVYDIEVPLALVLADMEWVGVSIDKKYLNSFAKELHTHLERAEEEIYELAQEKFNIASPKQVGQILFEKLQIKPPKKGKTKTGYSTNLQVLEQLAPDYPIVEKIIEYRHLSKLLGTYIEALPELIDPYDERIHASFNQTNTITGRLSSSNPNLQNIPIRTPLGSKIREAFVPKDKDSLILSADYSQIELRLLAHCSEDKNLIKAFNDDIDIHTQTAASIFGVSESEVTKDMRYKSKSVNFGIVYGQTRWGLASSLKISAEDAAMFISKYFATYPYVKKYIEETIAEAYEKGYVETLYGRRRYLADELHSSTRQIKEFAERAAINTPLQGTAADLIKVAMVDLFKKLNENKLKSKIIMQVHDELILEVPKSELEMAKKLTVSAMELNQPLKVPLKVDVNVAESWKEV